MKQCDSDIPNADGLPDCITALFWDVEACAVRWGSHRDFVIRRALDAGGMDALAWLRRMVGDAALRRWLMARQGAGLDRRRLRFYQVVLRIPRRSVDAWLTLPERAVWDGRSR